MENLRKIIKKYIKPRILLRSNLIRCMSYSKILKIKFRVLFYALMRNELHPFQLPIRPTSALTLSLSLMSGLDMSLRL